MRKTIRELSYEIIRVSWPNPTNIRILDVGAGTGTLAKKLADYGADVTALEYYPPETPVGKVEFVAHDLNQATLPFETATFDALVSTEVLEHLRAPFCVLTEMVRVLKPGGMMVLTIPNYWNIKYRIKYLLTGNFQRSIINNRGTRKRYLAGLAPHLNSITFPTLKAVLTWEGCEQFSLHASRMLNLGQRLAYLPFLALIRLTMCFRSKKQRLLKLLDETNGPAALLGRRHILVQCFKQKRNRNGHVGVERS